MFKPLRVNELLKAVGIGHQEPHSAKTAHTAIKETIDVDEVRKTSTGNHETHTRTRVREDVDIAPATHEKSSRAHVKAEVDIASVRTTSTNGRETTATLSNVHATIAGVAEVEMTPPHPPREDTPIYMKTHRHLVFTLDKPCAVCGVRKSTLADRKHNRFNAQDIETHHHPIERCLLDACDPKKVGVYFPQVKDRATLEAFVDSEDNMMVLCDIHHRHPLFGIHHLVGPDFNAQPFLYEGYQVVTEKENAAEVMAADEKIIRKHLTTEQVTHGEAVVQKTITRETIITKKPHHST